MTFDAECEFPARIETQDPEVLRLMLTAQTLTEQVGGVFDPERFITCEHEDQAPTLMRFKEQTLKVCCKHAKAILRLSPDGKPFRPAAEKSRQTSGGYSTAELAG